MGNCATPQTAVRAIIRPDAAKVIHVDGRLQEFRQPIKAGNVIAKNPSCFLCSSEFMDVDSHMPHMGEDEVLQPGQIYFLMPLETSQNALSLHDLCELAIKASVALRKKQGRQPPENDPSFTGCHSVRIPARSRQGSKIPDSYKGGDNHGIEY
ncbi:uncharacterized protein LOC131219065 [Magnolia sinica]|uniref:uncharacterized protein LOC131219065 n=1 Tax=Magnolia sinica TaxID=86752 RepID=UPI00265A52DA|nr:uncharacterized protein LOC131219065 [Magnolia sinica]